MLIDFGQFLIPMLVQITVEIHYSYHHCSWVVEMTTIESPIHFQNMATTGFK